MRTVECRTSPREPWRKRENLRAVIARCACSVPAARLCAGPCSVPPARCSAPVALCCHILSWCSSERKVTTGRPRARRRCRGRIESQGAASHCSAPPSAQTPPWAHRAAGRRRGAAKGAAERRRGRISTTIGLWPPCLFGLLFVLGTTRAPVSVVSVTCGCGLVCASGCPPTFLACELFIRKF